MLGWAHICKMSSISTTNYVIDLLFHTTFMGYIPTVDMTPPPVLGSGITDLLRISFTLNSST